MQRQVLIAAGSGLASALMSLGLLAAGGSFAILAYLAPLPLCLAGFSAGFRTAVIAGAVSIAALFVLGGFAAAGLYTLSIMLPTWVVVYHALSHRMFANGATGWYTPGDIVSRLSALGAVFVAVVTLAQMGNEDDVEASVRTFLTASLAALMPESEVAQLSPLLDRVVPLFPSFAALSWLVMMVVNATLAQALLAKWGKALRTSPDYARIEAPEWASWLIVGAAALKIVSSGDFEYLAQNLVVILAAPFFFVGLAVVHTLVKRTRFAGAGLAAFYLLLMLFTWVAAVVAALGFAEQWARLRDRYGGLPGGLAPRQQSEDD